MEDNTLSSNQYPDILTQFTRDQTAMNDTDEMRFATIGDNQGILGSGYMAPQSKRGTFDTVIIKKNTGPLTIYGKRWYFRLVTKKDCNYKRARALMDDFTLNHISHHMIVCFTPTSIPGNTRPFRNRDGNPIRIYAFFDSYLEFYEYMEKFPPIERAFYEIIFGELPQKPHFDIDISISDLNMGYPGEDINIVGETLREAVMRGCIEVLAEKNIVVDIASDMLLYSSHGEEKRSYHIVINNKCHDGNKEAQAFYNAVMIKVKTYTNGKYLDFVDRSVYSPRQQFRMIGSQKNGSNRPKIFYEKFNYLGNQYTHNYTEEVNDPTMKKLTIIYESMVSFTSGCIFLPSLVPPKPVNQNNLGILPNLDRGVVDQCMSMLREKMAFCPFTVNDVNGHIIMLKRNSPSKCPICQKVHENENPYMVIAGGKVYWDCRRSKDDANKFFVGYLAMSIDELQAGDIFPSVQIAEEDDDKGGEFMFGEYNIGPPTLPVHKSKTVVIENTIAVPDKSSLSTDKAYPNIYIPPPEQRKQNVQNSMFKIAKDWSAAKYIRKQPEDLHGVRKLTSVSDQMAWIPGMK